MENFFGLPLFDFESVIIMFSRFLLNGIVLISVSTLYLRSTKKKQTLFTFVLFNISVFFLIYLMSRSDIGIGFGFGLFAIFTILRYRTETINLKNATYLFVFIMVAAVNGMTAAKISLFELLFINGILIVATWIIEQVIVQEPRPKLKKTCLIVYENVDNIKLENRGLLVEDLKSRTGLNIVDVKTKDIDFLKGKADLLVTYLENRDDS